MRMSVFLCGKKMVKTQEEAVKSTVDLIRAAGRYQRN